MIVTLDLFIGNWGIPITRYENYDIKSLSDLTFTVENNIFYGIDGEKFDLNQIFAKARNDFTSTNFSFGIAYNINGHRIIEMDLKKGVFRIDSFEYTANGNDLIYHSSYHDNIDDFFIEFPLSKKILEQFMIKKYKKTGVLEGILDDMPSLRRVKFDLIPDSILTICKLIDTLY